MKMKELTQEQIQWLGQSYPGTFAIYLIEGEKVKTVYASDKLPGLSGMTAEEYDNLTKEDAENILFPADQKMVKSRLKSMLVDFEEREFTFRILHKVKKSVWIHGISNVLGTLDGKPVVIVAYSGTSREAEEHENILNHISSIVYVIDRESFELLYANEAAMKAWNESNYMGQLCYSFINEQENQCSW